MMFTPSTDGEALLRALAQRVPYLRAQRRALPQVNFALTHFADGRTPDELEVVLIDEANEVGHAFYVDTATVTAERACESLLRAVHAPFN